MGFNFLEGEVLLIDKPKGWTSFDVVNKVRFSVSDYLRKSSQIEAGAKQKVRVGHAGTLDPMATGLLILCTGKKTKTIDELMGLQKEYTGTFALGGITPSYDAETEVSEVFPTEHITEASIFEAAKVFSGVLEQMPPAFSAKKIGGTPAYKIARKGMVPALSTSTVTVFENEITGIDLEKKIVSFRVLCSKGTYIRSLVHDMAKHLHSGAYLTSLCRTRIGDFLLENADSVPDFVSKLKETQQ